MANRWRVGIPATILVFAALHALAQVPSSPTAADCPECDALVRVVARDQDEVNRLKAELENERAKLLKAQAAVNAAGSKLAPSETKVFDDNVARAQERFSARTLLLAQDLDKLQTCRGKCAMRGPPPPLPPVIPLVRNPEPAWACLACVDAALAALDILERIGGLEIGYFDTRGDALREYAWLVKHAGDRNDPEYLRQIGQYVNDLYRLAERQNAINDARQSLDRAMNRLTACNAACPKDSGVPGIGTPVVPAPIPSPADEQPKADCADCEPDALALQENLALQRAVKTAQASHTARKAAILARSQGRKLTDAERAQIENLDLSLRFGEGWLARIQKDIDKDRVALDACKCPPKTATQPDVGTPPGTPGVKPPSATQPPPADTTKPAAPGAPGTPSKTPSPGNQGTPTPPPSGNAPPPKPVPPKGGAALPTPNPVAGAPAPLGTTNDGPLAWDDDDDDTEEEYFTFAVPVDTDLKTLLANPFFKDKEPWIIPGEQGGNYVTIWGGETPGLTSSFLSDLQKRGVISGLDSYADVCWHFRPAADPFVPAPGAWVLYTLPSPTPTLNPGDRPGDEGPPAVARAGRDGKYNAPLARPNGSVEVRVAKGCSEHTSVEATVPAGELKRP